MLISNSRILESEGRVFLSAKVDGLGFSKELWFSTTTKYADIFCAELMDCFMLGMLYLSLINGEDIYVDGKVSKRLLFNANNYLIPYLIQFYPKLKPVKVAASQVSTVCFQGGGGVGTGFSGGIDSFCTIYDHYVAELDPAYKINKLMLFNVGNFGCGGRELDIDYQKKKFDDTYLFLLKYPQEVGLDFIPIDSNLHEFNVWDSALTGTLSLAAGVLAIQGSIDKYYIASVGFNLKETLKYHSYYFGKEIEYLEPIITSLLSTESLEFILDGTQYTRTQKLQRIVDYEPVSRYLHVCISGDAMAENCSVCSKCCRTLMALKSLNKLDAFAGLFDVEKYEEKAERKYLCKQVLAEDDAFAIQNIELAKKNNIPLPSVFECKIAAIIKKLYRRLRSIPGGIKRRLLGS